MAVKGIDVSAFQGAVDWSAFKGQIGFAAAKATEGTFYTNPFFSYDWKGMKDIDVFRFAYHFAHPDESPYTQASYFVDTVKKNGFNHGDNLFLDLEASFGQGPKEVSAWAIEFIREVKRLAPKHRVLVYTFPFFAEEGYCDGLENYYLWIANYDVSHPTVPAPWKEWAIWQYTATGLDRDVFSGDEKLLKDFCTTTGKFSGF